MASIIRYCPTCKRTTLEHQQGNSRPCCLSAKLTGTLEEPFGVGLGRKIGGVLGAAVGRALADAITRQQASMAKAVAELKVYESASKQATVAMQAFIKATEKPMC